jgi:hypothetical protein
VSTLEFDDLGSNATTGKQDNEDIVEKLILYSSASADVKFAIPRQAQGSCGVRIRLVDLPDVCPAIRVLTPAFKISRRHHSFLQGQQKISSHPVSYILLTILTWTTYR